MTTRKKQALKSEKKLIGTARSSNHNKKYLVVLIAKKKVLAHARSKIESTYIILIY